MTNQNPIITIIEQSEKEFAEKEVDWVYDEDDGSEQGYSTVVELPEIFKWHNSLLLSLIEKQIEMGEGMQSECTCSCEFRDGCLCIQNRAGFNVAKKQFLAPLYEAREELKKKI